MHYILKKGYILYVDSSVYYLHQLLCIHHVLKDYMDMVMHLWQALGSHALGCVALILAEQLVR